MSPVESMAAGKPVIGVAEGGLLEIVIHEETGLLLQPDFSEADIRDAVKQMTEPLALSMRSACEERAKMFSREKFIEKIVLAGCMSGTGTGTGIDFTKLDFSHSCMSWSHLPH